MKSSFAYHSILAQRLVGQEQRKEFQVARGKPVGFDGIPIFHTLLGTENWFKFQMCS